MAHLEHFFGKDFWCGVGQREDDRFLGHAGHHLLANEAASGQAEHHIGSVQRIRQIAGRAILGKGRFVLVEFAGIKSGFGDDALAVHQRDVAHRHADGHVVVGTGDGRGSSANDDDLEVGQRLALKFSSVEQGGCGDDGGAVLVVVHDGNVGGL